jgi:A/G-specific adenine glycosylase
MQLFSGTLDPPTDLPCPLPSRSHSLSYHQPLLLRGESGRAARQSLLQWFDSKSTARAMPWRKPWVDPQTVADDPAKLRALLEKRAYEVWISEIMLQQTRVAVVIDYWNRWMSKWPTIHDLAMTDRPGVLAAWQGLGYYSRATRIHEASRLVVDDAAMRGLLPEAVEALQANVPGVGRYTAGAISAIVFGRAEPMVDGNVLRVLSRQLGIFGNVKTDKAVIDTLWAAADALVKEVARDGYHGHDEDKDTHQVSISDRPGRWGQGLMELGSTVCTPKPDCSQCPITSTCRVYNEARASAAGPSAKQAAAPVVDIEDLCNLCEPFEDVLGEEAKPKEIQQPKAVRQQSTGKQTTLASFAFTRQAKTKTGKAGKASEADSAAVKEAIASHAQRFPLKVAKKHVREEATLVCAIRRPDGAYLVHRRPDKGLLAGLWEFPSHSLGSPNDSGGGSGREPTAKDRKKLAQSYVTGILSNGVKYTYAGEIGTIPWVFSHLKLAMHVHLFELKDGAEAEAVGMDIGDGKRWSGEVGNESMGTGMKKCWALARDALATKDDGEDSG